MHTYILFLLSMSFQIGVNHLIELLTRTGSSFLEPRRLDVQLRMFSCVNGRSIPHPSYRVSFSRLIYLESSPIFRARSRVKWSFTGVPAFLSPFFFSSRVKVVHLERRWRRVSIPQTFEPMHTKRALTPKTTMP